MGDLCFDVEKPLSSSSWIAFFQTESDHMPCHAYSPNPNHRRLILASIYHHFSSAGDPFSFTAYLAGNYMDRFLSFHPIIADGKPWILELVAVSCVSLAMKMATNTIFSLSNFHFQQHVAGITFDSTTLQRMEMLILDTLKWRMRSINPFSFIAFFLSFFEPKEPKSIQELKVMATRFIFKVQHEIKLLEFKPSMVAASALLIAARQLFPLQLPSFSHSIFDCEYINKEELLNCLNTMQELESEDLGLSMAPTSYMPNVTTSTSGSKRMRQMSLCIKNQERIQKCLKL